MALTTDFQKVLEASTKVTQNVTGYLRLYLKYGNRDVENNQDTIYYEIRQYAYNPYGNYLGWEWTGSLSWNIKLGGSTKASGSYTQSAVYSNGQEVVRASGSWIQPHNDDGNWSSSISFEGYVYQTKVSSSGTIELPMIARASTIAVSNGNIGSNVSIVISKASSDAPFTHTLTYKYGNLSGTIAEKTSLPTYNWPLPTTFYSQTPSTNLVGTVYCKTYSGNTQIGETKQDTFTAYVDETTNQPVLSSPALLEVYDETSLLLTGNNKTIIKDYSDLNVTIQVDPKADATLKEYRIEVGNQSKTSQFNNKFDNVSTNKINAYVKDTRGFRLHGQYPYEFSELNLLDYFKPQITTLNIKRTEQTSTSVVLTLEGTYWNKSFGSITNVGSIQYSWRCKSASSNTWDTWSNWANPTISGSKFSITGLSLGTTYATNASYDFQIRIKDALSNLDESEVVVSTSQNVTVSTPIVEVYEDSVNINGALTIFDREIASGSSNYSDLTNKPALNTNNTSAQSVSSSESINGTIKLHKVSKTGGYGDLLNKPVLNTNNGGSLGVSGSESINGTISLHKVSKTGNFNDLLNRPTIPSNTTQLTNGSGYINTSASSKAQNGYFKLSNGLIVQWGTCSTGSAVTMPTSFSSTSSFAIVGTDAAQGASATINIVVNAANKFTAYAKYGSTYYTDTIRWIAIGY